MTSDLDKIDRIGQQLYDIVEMHRPTVDEALTSASSFFCAVCETCGISKDGFGELLNEMKAVYKNDGENEI